jgi:general stress protein 26
MNLRKSVARALLRSYKARKQRASRSDVEHCLCVARQTVARTKYAFLISHGISEDGGGPPSARLVEPILETRDDDEDLVFWIGTNPSLRKVAEVEANPRVTLAFGHQRERANLVVYGTASVVAEPELRRRLWKGEWRLFFPRGPLADDYVLLRVEARCLEILSFRRNVVPEPFGLRPVRLVRREGAWGVDAG